MECTIVAAHPEDTSMAISMTEAVKSSLLKRVPMFADIPQAEFAAVVMAASPLAKRRGARVLEENSPADCCLVLIAGRAKVVISGARDVEITVGLIEPVALVGELGLIDGAPRSASLVALDDCQFIRISATAFGALRRNARFEQQFLDHVVMLLRRANDQLRAIYTLGTEERLLWWLGRLATRAARDNDCAVVRPKPTDQELADMVGGTRETINRKLRELIRKKCLTADADGLRIHTEAAQSRFPAVPFGATTLSHLV
jgi:CRP/FNR family transcriptional regulator, cyclic AMP receptor protein